MDLEASHLCGYLNIRGLTEDWPELTTFFDAEIIGDRHSFVTNKWGAKEANDMTHWVCSCVCKIDMLQTGSYQEYPTTHASPVTLCAFQIVAKQARQDRLI